MKSKMPQQALTDKYQRAFQNGYDGAQQHWRKALLALWLLVVGVCTWEFVGGPSGVVARRDLQAQAGEIKARNERLAREAQALDEQVRLLATDDFIAEKTIREQMNLARPGEITYLFNETEQASGSSLPMTFDDVIIAPRPPKKEEAKPPAPGH